jgi:hemin uptake protein HemP
MHASDPQPELSLKGLSAQNNRDDSHPDEGGTPQSSRTTDPPRRSLQPRPPRAPSIRRIGSRELMGPSGQLIIRHGGDDYRLRITRQGKLILTK